MTSPTPRNLHDRIARLEFLIVLLCATLLILIALLLTGASKSKLESAVSPVLRAELLAIVDAEGQVVATLGSNEFGGTLSILGGNDSRSVRVENDRHGGVVEVFHADGRKGVTVGQYQYTDTKTGGIVNVFDHDEETVVTLGTGDDYGGPVGMGANYDGGAIVVVREGVIHHISEAALRRN